VNASSKTGSSLVRRCDVRRSCVSSATETTTLEPAS